MNVKFRRWELTITNRLIEIELIMHKDRQKVRKLGDTKFIANVLCDLREIRN